MSFGGNLSNKYRKQLLDTAIKAGLDAAKTASKKVIHNAAEVTGKFIGNKLAEKVVKPKPWPDINSWDVEETVIPPEKREEILSELRQILQKWNTLK